MKRSKLFAAVLFAATLLSLAIVASADVAVPGPRPPRPSPQQPPATNNGVVYVTVKEGASPAQLELPREMTRRDGRRSDAAESSGRFRLAAIAGAGTATLLLAGMIGFARMGQFRGGRAMLVFIAAGIAFTAGASIVAADLAVEPRPEPAKETPAAAAHDGPMVVVRATEDAKGVMLVVSPDVLRKAIADAETAQGETKK